VLLFEFKHGINRYLSGLPNELSKLDLEALITFNEKNAADEMPYFRQEIFIKAQEKGPLTDPDYVAALERIQHAIRDQGLDRLLNTHDLDAIIAPTSRPAFMIDLINGDHLGRSGDTSFPAISGYPHLTLPMGMIEGLPVGLLFMGAKHSDADLLGMAYAFEGAHEAHSL
jgi:amidase